MRCSTMRAAAAGVAAAAVAAGGAAATVAAAGIAVAARVCGCVAVRKALVLRCTRAADERDVTPKSGAHVCECTQVQVTV